MRPLDSDLNGRAAARRDSAGGLSDASIASDPRFDRPTDAERTAFADRAAQRAIRALQDGFGLPDMLLHNLQDAAESDGQPIRSTPAVRAFCRAVQKHLEGGHA